ncbi:MAG: hypothetical protein HZC40_15700 [Chloroflexi bacterium]|nr:hypothetical protein [Chloroflexota bacterium]
MQTQKIGTAIKIFGVVIGLFVFCVMPATTQAAPDALNTITLAGEFSDADAIFLRTNLETLRDQFPTWYQYVIDAQPLTIAIDSSEGALGHAAIAKCCDAQGRGVITFGFHFGQSPDDAEQTIEAQRVAFIGTLVHEVTHIRDQRAGRFTTKTDYKSCVAIEKSGLEKQLEVKRALATGDLGAAFAHALNQQIGDEATALRSRELWQHYCGAFQN